MPVGAALPPAFAYLPEVFVEDPFHVAAREAARAWIAERGVRGVRVVADLGEEGFPAARVASAFAERGCARVALFGGPFDGTGRDVLAAALADRGLEVEWMPADQLAPRAPVAGDPDVIPLPADHPRGAELAALLRALAPREPSPADDRRRLLLPLDRLAAPGRGGGAPWGIRLLLHDAEWRAALTALIARAFPQHVPAWRGLGTWFDHGLSPLEEMYAGNSLPERNAELLANIVAPETTA